jgi:O-antigen ligase
MPLNRLAQPDAETGALARNPGKGVSFLLVLMWGVVAAYGGHKGWRSMLALVCLGATAALSPQFSMEANVAALGFGVIVFGVALLAPSFALGMTVGGLALWMLAAPFFAPVLQQFPQLLERLPLSWQQRVEIWRFAEARIMEKPITGWGLDGARSFRGQLSQIGDLQFPSLPLHPHSASLHVWLELGAIGAALAAAAILAVGAAAAKALHADRHRMAATAAAIATIGVIWNVSYGAWQEWWMITPFVAAALIVAGRKDASTHGST